ncbi:DNA-binding protein [Geotalea sp. SG265]|uniref:DNA-binding protein n=1 Tax=Geotalea sp. SG265 TaxID=2922867 RepID=UPI001FAF5792|nr:DNA-binding protein [Geotalea sp. SG265]
MTPDAKKLIFFISFAAVIAGGAASFASPAPEPSLSEKDQEMARKERELEEKLEREAAPRISGKIQETMDSGSYTYVLLADGEKKTWVAMPQMKVVVGQELIFNCNNEMVNFTSRSLNRTFDRIYFCEPPAKQIGGEKDGIMAGKVSAGSAGAVAAPAERIKVDKAAGANAYTVEELYSKRGELDNKAVAVKGKVVKFSAGIMGKNWIHVQDGSGDAKKRTNNLVVTSQDTAKVGDTVTVNGTLKADKDFGSGYKYDVIVEEAAIK